MTAARTTALRRWFERPSDSVLARVSRSAFAPAIVFCVAHVPLAVMMRAYSIIATVHAIACLGVGLYVAATSRRIASLTVVVAYICGCEVLWRMCKASVFWEFAKYAVVAILLLAITRIRTRRNLVLAATYFALLVPSIALTFTALDPATAREQVSANLSGPLSIAVATVFFSSIRLDGTTLRTIFVGFIAPIIGIGALAVIRTQTADHLDFVNAANRVTSGGFGPNQVAAVLGLGVMLLLILSIERSISWGMRVITITVAAALAAQAALTFARGGLVLALAGFVSCIVFLARSSPRTRAIVITVSVLCAIVGTFVIVPQVEEATGGKIVERYTNTESSGRDQLAASEMRLFLDNPALGVGPGVGVYKRLEEGGFGAASHTEYTRMLGEHGILGLLSLGCLVYFAGRAIRMARTRRTRGLACAMVMWTGLFLGIYSTRLAAPALVLGIACALRSPPPERRASSALPRTAGT